MATFEERAANSVILVLRLIVLLPVVSHFGFEVGALVVIAQLPCHCSPCLLSILKSCVITVLFCPSVCLFVVVVVF